MPKVFKKSKNVSAKFTSYYAINNSPYLQPMSGLGSYNRTAGAVILGGPRAGAGSAVRLYNYLTNIGALNSNLANLQKILRAQYYNASQNSRNYSLGW
jgi:hypothetical protein